MLLSLCSECGYKNNGAYQFQHSICGLYAIFSWIWGYNAKPIITFCFYSHFTASQLFFIFAMYMKIILSTLGICIHTMSKINMSVCLCSGTCGRSSGVGVGRVWASALWINRSGDSNLWVGGTHCWWGTNHTHKYFQISQWGGCDHCVRFKYDCIHVKIFA